VHGDGRHGYGWHGYGWHGYGWHGYGWHGDARSRLGRSPRRKARNKNENKAKKQAGNGRRAAECGPHGSAGAGGSQGFSRRQSVGHDSDCRRRMYHEAYPAAGAVKPARRPVAGWRALGRVAFICAHNWAIGPVREVY
jgi:hypothetical protein